MEAAPVEAAPVEAAPVARLFAAACAGTVGSARTEAWLFVYACAVHSLLEVQRLEACA